MSNHRMKLALITTLVGIWSGLPASLVAGNVTIENNRQEDIAVASAFNHGTNVSQGWTRIAPKQKHTFEFPDDQDAYLRIEHKGSEVTFSLHQKFLLFPLTGSRFTVTNDPNDK